MVAIVYVETNFLMSIAKGQIHIQINSMIRVFKL